MDTFIQKFEGRLNNLKLSEAGKQWIVSAFDPFHDMKHNVEGIPDSVAGMSRVVRNTTSRTITKPETCDAGEAWDCCITNAPYDTALSSALDGTPCKYFADTLWEAGAGGPATAIVGDVHVYTAPVNVDFAPVDGVWNADVRCVDVASVRNADDMQPGRRMSMGIEVTNTTAEIYKSGAVHVATVPFNQRKQLAQYAHLVGNTFGNIDVISSEYLKPTVSNMSQHATYQTWAAAKGIYAVVPINGVNPIVRPAASMFVGMMGGLTSTDNIMEEVNYSVDLETIPTDPAQHVMTVFGRDKRINNADQTMIIFKGLTNESSLELCVKSQWELFPRATSDYFRTVTPSPQYDFRAMALYSALLSELPSGVPVGMNAKGDFWKMVLSAVDKVAPTLLGMINPALPPAYGVIRNLPYKEIAKPIAAIIGNKKKKKAAPSRISLAQRASMGYGKVRQ